MIADATPNSPEPADTVHAASSIQPAAGGSKRFFSRVDWSAFWTSSLLALLVYGMTLAPTVTLEDSGELAVGSDHLGVPHPPGYPIWTIITWVFTRVFFFVQFRGQPNPAWAVGFASAVFGALASGMTAILLCRSGRDMLRSIRRTTEVVGERTENLICWSGGVAASLVFAFSPVNWSQSVIVEVYALNAFFLVTLMFLVYVWMRRPDEPLPGVTWLILIIALVCLGVMGSRVALHLVTFTDFRKVGIHYVLGYLLLLALAGLMARIWRRRPQDRLLYLISLTFGLGLTNYQVLLLLLVSLAVTILVRDMQLFRDFIVAGIPFALYYLLATHGIIQHLLGPGVQVTYLGIVHPTHPLTYLYVALNFGWLALLYRYLPHGRTVAPAIVCLELGLAVYAFMPMASEMNPPINWGYPRTWEGFVHAITRGQYETIRPTPLFSAQFAQQVGDYMTDLRIKFLLPVAILGMLPFTAWTLRTGRARFRALYAAVAMAALAVALIAAEEIVVPTGAEWTLLSRLYHGLIAGLAVLMTVGGLVLVVAEIEDLTRRLLGRDTAVVSERITAGLVLLAGAAAVVLCAVKVATLVSDPLLDLGLSQKAGLLLLALAPVGAAVLVRAAMRGAARLDMDYDRDDQKWILATLAGFVVMSVVLVALASPKGDIQDEFVQRVKFISSHALFAFWIGYGLILGMAAVDTVCRGNRLVIWAGLAVVTLGLPALPLLQNAYNRQLLHTDGGAEQNGHDFGWQFGNYQLRGSEAIAEELLPDEEPLPDPSYPPAMEPRAVFFGGTDPGRFVPTYMIYSADVRPDVYLITQNALADNTYMNVMRDLYGNSIWIPSFNDGNKAFQKYIEDVQAGRMPPSADIRIENGRIKVQGVGGVMLINGLLAKMIFEHNKARHRFYVEESYAIPWMYPYLFPHGLIMAIRPEPEPSLPEDLVRNDMDFWDWYTRRLCGNRRFLRDVCARKSFSKLRTAIAGLYVSRAMYATAERAFLEAVRLYPLSPEASFRLADLYLRWNRADDAIRVMEEFGRQDPGNDRVAPFIRDVRKRRALNDQRLALEKQLLSGQGGYDAGVELADIYRQLGLVAPFTELLRSMSKQKDLPARVSLRIARLAADERDLETMELALASYTAAIPADMRAWIDLGAVRLLLGRNEHAFAAVRQAVATGREAALAIIRKDPRFDSVRNDPAFLKQLQ